MSPCHTEEEFSRSGCWVCTLLGCGSDMVHMVSLCLNHPTPLESIPGCDVTNLPTPTSPVLLSSGPVPPCSTGTS
ncbi:unnamed protein product [Arctogadus glacialis]